MAKDMVLKERDPQTYALIGVGMAVHRELGHGFSEAVYGDAMEVEFRARLIPYAREVWMTIGYKGQILKSQYRADFLCFGDIIVEIKARKEITGSDRAQVINYLKATGKRRALILNFGLPSLRYERIVLGPGGQAEESDEFPTS
jgi:GxxExxY protein